jgi:hypothetical protein
MQTSEHSHWFELWDFFRTSPSFWNRVRVSSDGREAMLAASRDPGARTRDRARDFHAVLATHFAITRY